MDTKLNCDICGSPMTMEKNNGQVSFSCENPSCEQSWVFSKDYSSCTILKHLWPSRMKEGSKMYREEYLPEWLKAREFYANAMFIAGFWDSVKRDEKIQKCRGNLDKWHEEHPPKRRPWWQFWVPV